MEDEEKKEKEKKKEVEVETNNRSIKENVSNTEFGSLKNIDKPKRKSLKEEPFKEDSQKRKSIQFGEVKDT